MKITLNLKRTLHQNAAEYFELSKKFRKKAEGAKRALASSENRAAKRAPIPVIRKSKPKWYEEFHFTHTSSGFLVVAGKSAKQNDQLFSHHLKAGDVFLHADVIGAPATILKAAGKTPSERDLAEAAILAASYSRAWKQGLLVADVYAVSPEQVSKYSQGEFVGKGAFLIAGKRQWFKNTALGVWIDFHDGTARVALSDKPGVVHVTPGATAKEKAANALAKKFSCRQDDVLSVLPGDCAIE